MKKVGFIGLGMMGFPVAENLINAGYKLYLGYHSNRKPAELLAEKGAVICNSYKEVAENSDVIFTVVPNDKEVEEVLFGKDGLCEGLKPGSAVFDMSTIDLTRSREFAMRLKDAGVYFFDAPVSGGPEGAKAKTLAIMVGGDKKIFDENIELLKTSGKSVVYCGESGLGLAAKIANNLIVGAQMAAIAEGVSLAVKAGIDINQLYEVLKNSSSNSATLNAKLPKIISKDFDPSFKLSLMYKDMTVAANVGRKLGTPTLMTTLAEQIYGMCMKDHSGEDFAAIVKFFADQSQVEL